MCVHVAGECSPPLWTYQMGKSAIVSLPRPRWPTCVALSPSCQEPRGGGTSLPSSDLLNTGRREGRMDGQMGWIRVRMMSRCQENGGEGMWTGLVSWSLKFKVFSRGSQEYISLDLQFNKHVKAVTVIQPIGRFTGKRTFRYSTDR